MKILICFALIVATLSTGLSKDLSDRKITSFFEDAALSWSTSTLSRKDQSRCKKIDGDVKIFLQGYWDAWPKFLAQQVVYDFNSLTDSNITFTNEKEHCNFYISIGMNGYERPDGIKISNFSNYDAFIDDLGHDFKINSGVGFINEKHKNHKRAFKFYLYRIIAVHLGFTNLANYSGESIFSNSPFQRFSPQSSDIEYQLSEIDKIAFKLLYQKEIKRGMTSYEVIRTIRENNLIQKVR